MVDMEGFRADLREITNRHGVDAHLSLSDDQVADLLADHVRMLHRVRDTQHENEERFHNLLSSVTGATSARPRTIHMEQREVPEPAKIEALPATEDWCACGWSDEPHDRFEHAPLQHVTGPGPVPSDVDDDDDAPTPPHAACDKFESQAGAFAVVQASVCATCGASARAHGITEVGPPTQIVEVLTLLED